MPSEKKLTHLNQDGSVNMVDVSSKDVTLRKAKASARIKMSSETLNLILENRVKKGNVLETARLAGIMGGKKTSDLIPLSHPISISNISIDFTPNSETGEITIYSEAIAIDRTGVEMEAMSAVSISALTIYDMCKSVERGIVISDIMLLEKSGGKSGKWSK